ncbi:ABC transporter permease [Hymenobacter psychrotolerans]|uniref:Peptide/nickel transport system permease protein n=1 Tax=Hymenobacter psychrotolerans DSM 18569 TaxID=1121959 RepID=A0A1M6RXS4_9BACT|nr:peptide/nickel transport system permease protein [Hymenobacter psychrotolerans DSM 18569]
MSRNGIFSNWSGWLSFGWLLLLLIGALLADAVTLPSGPDLLRASAAPLTPGHLLGTDSQGQDVLSGILHGARTTLLISLPTAISAATLGTALGVVAGYWGNTRLRLPRAWVLAGGGALLLYTLLCAPERSPVAGWWPLVLASGGIVSGKILARRGWGRTAVVLPADTVVSASMVFLAAVPRLLLVLVVAATIEPSISSLILLLTLTFWVPTARLVRAEVQRIRQLPYFEAATALGVPAPQIILRHVLPGCWPLVRTSLPLSLAVLISLETTLSFLGVGLPPEMPSWGRVLAAGRVSPTCWWLIIFPTMALLFTALSLRRLLPDLGQSRVTSKAK